MTKDNLFKKNILIVGLGSIGERHLRNLKFLGARSIYVLRRKNKDPRTVNIKDYNYVNTIKEALEKDISAAIIATPSSNHTEILETLIQNNIPVLLEVPISNKLDKLDDIYLYAKENNVPILVGHNLKFHPSLKKIKNIIQSSQIGNIYFSRSQFGEYLPECHPWEDYKLRYEARKELGGGAILTSIHEIDHAVWLFGKVKCVTCVSRTLKLPIDVDDVSMIIMEHHNGILSEIELDFIQRPYSRNLQVCADKSSIEWGLIENNLLMYDINNKNWQKINPEDDYDINQTYIDELNHFSNVIYNQEAPITSLQDSIHVLNVALSAIESSRQRKTIFI